MTTATAEAATSAVQDLRQFCTFHCD